MSRTAVIAGVGPGLGASLVRKFANEGCPVGMFARSEANLQTLAGELGETKAEVLPVPVDITDPEQVTASFNKNLLTRINHELGGHFDLDAFAHEARWNEEEGRVEMHLVSQRVQTVQIDGIDAAVDLAMGESIHTENSYKYSAVEIEALAAAASFNVECQWFDAQNRFSVNLWQPIS